MERMRCTVLAPQLVKLLVKVASTARTALLKNRAEQGIYVLWEVRPSYHVQVDSIAVSKLQ